MPRFRVGEGVGVRARVDALLPALVPDVGGFVGRRAAGRRVAPEVDAPRAPEGEQAGAPVEVGVAEPVTAPGRADAVQAPVAQVPGVPP